jgi:hypothetical protein
MAKITHDNKKVEETANALILMRKLVEPLKEVINKLKELGYVNCKAWEITDFAYADKTIPFAYKFEDQIKYSNEPLIYVEWDPDGYGTYLNRTVFPIKWLYEPIDIQQFEQTIRENKKIAEEKAKQKKKELAEKKERELYIKLQEKYGRETTPK